MNREQRADIVTARESLRRAASGADDVDFDAAAAMLDRVLYTSCPHGREAWHTERDSTGQALTTCPLCGVSWYGGE